VGGTAEARLGLARRSCPMCEYYLADIDGILLSASPRAA
jgi:hypothetical protein